MDLVELLKAIVKVSSEFFGVECLKSEAKEPFFFEGVLGSTSDACRPLDASKDTGDFGRTSCTLKLTFKCFFPLLVDINSSFICSRRSRPLLGTAGPLGAAREGTSENCCED